MRIAAVEAWPFPAPLRRPYTIAFKTFTAVDMMAVKVIAEDGSFGLGGSSPEPAVTGETLAACRAALAPEATRWLVGRDLAAPVATLREIEARAPATPAARAALDMALYDLWAKRLGQPLVDLLGRAHQALPTSITIGIKDVAATVTEAEEYVGRGFRVLKVKLGHSLAEDLTRLRALRARFPRVAIRTDANQGYRLADLRAYFDGIRDLGIEFTEQPVPAAQSGELRALDPAERRAIALDEALLGPADALRHAVPPAPAGIFNVKLMKCGGIRPALRIAAIAETAGLDLMWGCMDESVVGIAAALHAAFACPATRHLDLDGSLDLERDFAVGGFELRGGVLRTTGRPGLGVDLAPT